MMKLEGKIMKDEILKYLAEGHTKVDAMKHFELSRYRLNKVLSSEADCYDGFLKEFVDDDAEIQQLRMERVYRIYCGWCIENRITPGNVRGLISEILKRGKLNTPPTHYYKMVKTSNQVITLARAGMTQNKMDYYAKKVTNNMLRNDIAAGFAEEFDVDCISLLLGDMTLADFQSKWADFRSLYNKEIIPTRVAEKTVEEPVITEDIVYNDATSYAEEKVKDKKFSSFKALRKFFKYTKVRPLTVNAVLCDGRHDTDQIVTDLNADCIFESLERWQMSDATWMESKANEWVDKNIEFDGDGNALQMLRVYTTGYNPLNMTVAKIAMQRRINFSALYFNPNTNKYWEQKIVDQFPLERHPLLKFVDAGEYYIHGELTADEAYEVIVDVGGINARAYRFMIEDRDVVSMILKNLNYAFMENSYTITINKCNLKDRTKVYERFATEESFE